MKQKVLLSLAFLLFTASLFSQSSERIKEEANMDYQYVEDNSEYAKLWKQQLEARKSGDMETYNRVASEIKAKFPEKFHGIDASNQNILKVTNYQQPPFVSEWFTGDITVYAPAVGGQSPGNPRPFNRNIRLGADTLGNQYAAFTDGNKDTIIVFKSTNKGQSWTRLFSVFGGAGYYIHSFDMFITDSLNAFRLGFAICLETDGGPGFNGLMAWVSIDNNGNQIDVTIMPPFAGRGFISPAIVSDGFSWSAGTTYWYMTFQNCDTTTGVTSSALIAMSSNWGDTWVIDTARNSFNDYDLDVDYNWGADTIYVLLTNNLTTTDENLRLRYVPLSGIGTGITWKQSNTGATTGHDRMGILTANRQTNEMAILFTKFTATNPDIRLCYSPLGYGIVSAWTLDVPISALPGDENYPMIKCQETQGAYRICYVSSGGGYDTVIYMSSSALPTFGGKQVVNQTSNSVELAPDVVGYRDAGGFSGGVIYAGTGNTTLYYDGSAAILGVNPVNGTIPQEYSLQQNYPNPFNPSTTIRFSIPFSGLVTLKIFDVTGREVAAIVNGELKAGVYETKYNAVNLSSGIYFYRLTANEFTDTKKLMLVK